MTISTYLGYVTATKDMTTTLARVASQSTVKSDQAYYDANIGKVTTVDEFMSDYKLYSYAMTAYGLSDMTYAKAFMKKVMESDLSDSTSFANSLTDPKYKAFAEAFNFSTSTSSAAQSDTQETDTIGLYEQSFTTEASDAATATSYYNTNIDKVTSVDSLIGNTQLRDYVLQSVGIDPSNISTSYLKSVLTSDVSDPNSFVNQSGSAAFKQLASEFSFNADGTLTNATAQTAAQKADVESLYNTAVPSYTTSVGATDLDTYYKAEIGSITSVSDITSNSRLFSYVKTAYGLDPTMSATEFSLGFKSSTNAAIFGLTSVVSAFNFQSDGTVPAGETAQTADNTTAASTAFMSNYKTAQSTLVKDAEANYKTKVAAIKTISGFFGSNTTDTDTTNDDLPTVESMALRAYGISSDEVSQAQLTKILESDPYDPTSYVSKLGDSRFTALAKAFNFSSDGKSLKAPVQALSQTQMNSYVSNYSSNATIGLTGAEQTKAVSDAKTAATYFMTTMPTITTAAGFLADSKLVDFVLTANGIDPKTVTAATLKKAFASDPTDATGFLNTTAGSQLKSIVSEFNFDTSGNLTSSKLGTAQNEGARLETDDLYLHQTLETQQGDTNPGVRLALYFQRKAPDITSIYDIMSDSALYSVITTTFNLPSSMSNMDVTDQATMLQKFVNITDLHDPDKLNQLLERFSAMYDTANNTITSPALTILTSGSGSTGISADTLLSIAQLSSG